MRLPTIKAIAALIATSVVAACSQPPPSAFVATPAAASVPNGVATLMTRAREGDDQAAVLLAGAYYRIGNAAEAFKWLQVAANRGYALGQAGLGHAYTFGFGVPQDYSLALKYNRLAADQNDATGLNNLAYLYERGLGLPVDLTEATGLYRRAAMQGNAFAQQALGIIYQQGRSVRSTTSWPISGTASPPRR